MFSKADNNFVDFLIKKKINFNKSCFLIDVEGDEFWEEALAEDPTGIKPLTDTLKQIIQDSNLVINSPNTIDEIVKFTI